MIGIEDPLHALSGLSLDLGAAVAHGVVERHLAYDGAHRALRHFANGLVRLRHLEQIELGSADIPANRISEVDQILVASQHQVVGALGAHVDRPDILDVDFLHPIDRRRQGQADTRTQRAAVAAEARNHAALARRNRMHRGEDQPDQDEGEDGPGDQGPIRAAGKATAPTAEASETPAQELVERADIRARPDRRTAPFWSLAPRTLARFAVLAAFRRRLRAAGPAIVRAPRTLAVSEEAANTAAPSRYDVHCRRI